MKALEYFDVVMINNGSVVNINGFPTLDEAYDHALLKYKTYADMVGKIGIGDYIANTESLTEDNFDGKSHVASYVLFGKTGRVETKWYILRCTKFISDDVKYRRAG